MDAQGVFDNYYDLEFQKKYMFKEDKLIELVTDGYRAFLFCTHTSNTWMILYNTCLSMYQADREYTLYRIMVQVMLDHRPQFVDGNWNTYAPHSFKVDIINKMCIIKEAGLLTKDEAILVVQSSFKINYEKAFSSMLKTFRFLGDNWVHMATEEVKLRDSIMNHPIWGEKLKNYIYQ